MQKNQFLPIQELDIFSLTINSVNMAVSLKKGAKRTTCLPHKEDNKKCFYKNEKACPKIRKTVAD